LHFLHVSSTIKKTLEDVFMLLMDYDERGILVF